MITIILAKYENMHCALFHLWLFPTNVTQKPNIMNNYKKNCCMIVKQK